MMKQPKLHIAMFPWFAFGHMNPYLLLSNELAKRGHKVSFLLPNKAISQLQDSNFHRHLITFYPITVPHVDPLPLGTETASEIPLHLNKYLATALDLTRPQTENLLLDLKPDLVFYDMAYWIPEIAQRVGFKTVCYIVVSAACLAIGLIPSREPPIKAVPPPSGYPSTTVVFKPYEARLLSVLSTEFGNRMTSAMSSCDAIAIRTCQELEGDFCGYISEQYQKQVLLTGPVLPEPENKLPEDHWAKWLDRFGPGSVLFCAFGSQLVLEKDQFQELVLGFEITGHPFLVAVKPPMGASSIEEALPEGFLERVGERGVVCGGWVPQLQILSHKSIGCFVNHCGFGSMWESLTSHPQIVLVPHLHDQIMNTRLLANELKAAVEVEKDETGWFSKESLCNAVKSVMDEESDLASLVKKNHSKWRETVLSPGFMTNYIDKFIQNLYEL